MAARVQQACEDLLSAGQAALVTHSHNLLGEPPATLLPAEPGGRRRTRRRQPAGRGRGAPPDGQRCVGGAGRGGPAPAGRALHETIEAYAYARTGYHRGLDALRRNGWKGFGPVPWSHEPNRGFLRCVTRPGEGRRGDRRDRRGTSAACSCCATATRSSAPDALGLDCSGLEQPADPLVGVPGPAVDRARVGHAVPHDPRRVGGDLQRPAAGPPGRAAAAASSRSRRWCRRRPSRVARRSG